MTLFEGPDLPASTLDPVGLAASHLTQSRALDASGARVQKDPAVTQLIARRVETFQQEEETLMSLYFIHVWRDACRVGFVFSWVQHLQNIRFHSILRPVTKQRIKIGLNSFTGKESALSFCSFASHFYQIAVL